MRTMNYIQQNRMLQFQLNVLKYISIMFFESLIKKKEAVSGALSPRYDAIAQRKQIFIGDLGFKNQRQQPDEKILSINRSKSQKDFNNQNYVGLHLKHPILMKQRFINRQAGGCQKNDIQIQIQLREHKQQNIQKKYSQCQKYNRNFQKGERENDKSDLNDYQLKNNKKKISSNNKYMSNKDSKQLNSLSNYHSYQPYHNSAFSSSKNAQVSQFREQGQNFRGLSSSIPNHFTINLDKQNSQYFQQQTTKITQIDCENSNLRLMIKQLEKQISITNRERDKDKGKLLENSIIIDKLKFQNDCLKKTFKSKENVDVKQKDKDKERVQINQIKKALKQEIQSKQLLEIERKNILSELNQALVNQQNEKSKWEKQRKTLQSKIDSLVLETKQKKQENVLFAQKSNSICLQNKKLRENAQNYQKQLIDKESQLRWMTSKVNDLKQALQNFKLHGNSKIQKLEEELLLQIQNKRKDSQSHDLKQYQNKLMEKQNIIVQLRQQMQHTNSLIKNTKSEIINLKVQLDSKEKTINDLCKQLLLLKQQLSSLDAEQKDKAQNDQFRLKAHEQQILQKNKVIQSLARSLSDTTVQLQQNKKQKKSLQQQLATLSQKIHQTEQQHTKLNKQISQLSQQNQLSLKTRLQQQQNYIQTSRSLKKQMQKRQEIEHERSMLVRDVEKYRGLYLGQCEEKRKWDNQNYGVQYRCRELQGKVKEVEHTIQQNKKIIQFKETTIQGYRREAENYRKQILQLKYKLQCINKQQQNKQKLSQQKTQKILKLQQQLSNITSRLHQKDQQIKQLQIRQLTTNSNQKIQKQQGSQAGEQGERSLRRSSTTQSLNSGQNHTTYSQLEMKLCSILGVYLTSNVDKLTAPIEQLIQLKRKYELNSYNYEELLKIFEVKQNPYRLVSQMRQYKANYLRMLQNFHKLQPELIRLKQENSYLNTKCEQVGLAHRKLQILLDETNQVAMRAKFKAFNQKFNVTGQRRY